MKRGEALHQAALIQWFDAHYPKISPLLWHTPNGGSRKRVEAYHLKRQGVRAGVPDLFLAVPRGTFHGLFIEMKSEKGKLSELQKKYFKLLDEHSYHVVCCHGWREAVDAIRGYLDGY